MACQHCVQLDIVGDQRGAHGQLLCASVGSSLDSCQPCFFLIPMNGWSPPNPNSDAAALEYILPSWPLSAACRSIPLDSTSGIHLGAKVRVNVVLRYLLLSFLGLLLGRFLQRGRSCNNQFGVAKQFGRDSFGFESLNCPSLGCRA